MKKYLIAALAVVLLIVGTNYWVNPPEVLASTREQTIANILLSGKSAAIPRSQIDFEERRLLRALAQGMKQRPSTLAFGSSRFRYVTRGYLGDPTFFNHSINAATLEDLYTLYWYYKQKGMTPDRILIALDPWMIDRDVTYVQLINLAYANDFVRATDALGLALTENDKTVFASAIGEVNKDPDTAKYPISVPDLSILDPVGQSGTFEVASFTLPEGGSYELTFQARITTGTYYYGLTVESDQAGTLLSGGYLGPLANNELPSVHEFRTFRVSGFEAKAGERISINMVSTSGEGALKPGAGQNFEIRDVTLLRSCNDDVQTLSLFNAACTSMRFNREAQKYTWIRDLFSPAQFQQSLGQIGPLLTTPSEPADTSEQITAIDKCVAEVSYAWCADGSVARPAARSSVEEVLDIVRTVDDGIVPFVNADVDQLQNLQKFVDLLRADKVEVLFFLVPIHPFTFEKWHNAGDAKGFERAEGIYKHFAEQHGIPIFGSYNPATLGMSSDCFRDWVHPYPECLERVLDLAGLRLRPAAKAGPD